MVVAADTARTRASLRAALADMALTAVLATPHQLATEESPRLPHHLCGPDTAQKIAHITVLNATGCSVDASFATVVVADADLAAVAAVAVDPLAIQVDAVADLLTALDLPAVGVAKLPTSAPFVADISVAADVASSRNWQAADVA